MIREVFAHIRIVSSRDQGSTMSEYAILAALVAVALVVVVSLLAPPLAEIFQKTADEGLPQGS